MFSISTYLILETSLVTSPFQNIKDSSKNNEIHYNAELIHLIHISFALKMLKVLTYIVKESDFSCFAVADKKSVVLVD